MFTAKVIKQDIHSDSQVGNEALEKISFLICRLRIFHRHVAMIRRIVLHKLNQGTV